MCVATALLYTRMSLYFCIFVHAHKRKTCDHPTYRFFGAIMAIVIDIFSTLRIKFG